MKILKLHLAVLLLFPLIVVGCKDTNTKSETPVAVADEQQPKVALISAEAMFQLLESNPDVQLLDVRTAEEVAEGKIAGSINISSADPNFEEAIRGLDLTKPLYIYCRSGGRSANSADLVKEFGFPEIYDLDGGITAWETAGYSVVKE